MTTMERLQAHYEEAKTIFPEERIVGIFVYGSQNYELDTPESDIDTKCIVVPTFDDICFNKKPVSYTHVRANDEHIEFKDVRLMLNEFRKQNMNFVEILFTKYCIVNPLYADAWNRLTAEKEMVAHYNPVLTAIKMAGMAMQKRKALTHPYPSKLEVLAKFGYDPKQIHHIYRIERFLRDYIAGKSYAESMVPGPLYAPYLYEVKAGVLTLEQALAEADKTMTIIDALVEEFKKTGRNESDPRVDVLINETQKNIMLIALTGELAKMETDSKKEEL